MAFLTPLDRSDVPALEQAFQDTETFLGFLPNDVLTMARMPEATAAFMHFCISIYKNASLPQTLLHMVGMMASAAHGCRYCTAHTANKAFEEGLDRAKVAAMWEFETSPLFDEAERAALRFAFHAGQSPGAVEAEDYAAMRAHFSDGEITEMLFVICQFGFWNRWNDSVGTLLEDTPRRFAEDSLPEAHWTLDRHGG